jgi:Fic family protein
MSYTPVFTISPMLLSRVEAISAEREKIRAAVIEVPWIPALQKDARARNAHSSTAIEGNPLTLEQVRAIEEGHDNSMSDSRARREIINYFAALRHIEKNARKKTVSHEDVLQIHRIIAGAVMDQGEAGKYRIIRVRVGKYVPPAPELISGLMFELLEWWNRKAGGISPVISSAILHYRFEAIHPFADGNGRTGRALALWELYRRGFDSHHIFSVDEYFWENRPRYYEELQNTRNAGDDLTRWLEYVAEGILQTLTRVSKRIQDINVSAGGEKILLRPRQEQLLQLLRDRGGMQPREIWSSLKISKQGAVDLLRPLLKAGLVRREGTIKSGRYVLVIRKKS